MTSGFSQGPQEPPTQSCCWVPLKPQGQNPFKVRQGLLFMLSCWMRHKKPLCGCPPAVPWRMAGLQPPRKDRANASPPPGQASRANGASFPPRAESTKPALPFCGSWTCFGLFSVTPARTSLDQQPRHIPQQFGKCISSINDNRLFKQQLKHSDCFLVCSH